VLANFDRFDRARCFVQTTVTCKNAAVRSSTSPGFSAGDSRALGRSVTTSVVGKIKLIGEFRRGAAARARERISL